MKYPIFKVHVDKEAALKELDKVLGSGFLNEGEQVTELTNQLSKYLKHDKVVLLNSCTSALTLALRLAGVEKTDAVLSISMTCIASNTPIHDIGARIIWADINRETGNIDPNVVDNLLTRHPYIKAVLCVDWAGFPCDLQVLKDICDEHGVKLIQDAAHAFGATYNGQQVCHFAHYTCYSLQAIKHITCGDGGILVCEDEEDFKRAKKLKWFGIDREATKDAKGEWKGQRWNVDVEESGFKYHMNNISAAIGLSQMSHVEYIVNQHQANGFIYEDLFQDNPYIQLLKYPSKSKPSFWVYTLLLDESLDRDAILEQLNKAGIGAGVVHIPNHIYTCFKSSKADLPETDYFSRHQISLPCGWWLSTDDIKLIAKTLNTIIESRIQGEAYPEKWQTALNEFYESHGVGDTVKHKKAFWNKQSPNTCITHVETDEQWVKVMEFSWLVDAFPEDMKFA